jgi:hypothetical protein
MKRSNTFNMCEAARLRSRTDTDNGLMVPMLEKAKFRMMLEIYLLDIIISVKFGPTSLDR